MIDVVVNQRWNSAVAPVPRDPLAIDLDGDGIETVGIPASGEPILFDHNANGVKTGTGWLQTDDAWLVLDRDGNGSIDTGRELFGVDTLITTTTVANGNTQTTTRNAISGFEALLALESSSGSVNANNGIFNALDPDFARVRVWKDLNQDGISQTDELQTLAQAGIASISTTSTPANINLGNGNSVTGTAAVTRTNGSTTLAETVSLQAGNLDLANNPFYREFTDTIPLTDTAHALPEMGGSGLLRDLRQAMSLGTPYAARLVQAVDALANATTRDAQMALVDAVLVAWAQTTPQANEWLRDATTMPVNVGYVFSESRFAAALDAEQPGWRDLAATADFRYGSYNAAAQQLVQIAQNHHLIQGVQWIPTTYVNGSPTNWALRAQVPQHVTVGEMVGTLGQVSILQVFNGAEFPLQTVYRGDPWTGDTITVQAPNSNVSALLDQSYVALSRSVYSAVALQTRLRPHLDAIDLVIEGSEVRFDTTALHALLTSQYSLQPQKGLEDLAELLLFAAPTLLAVGYDGLQTLRGWIEALPSNSALWAVLDGVGVRYGDSLTATERGEVLLGGTGNNTFNGLGGDDIIDGGAGNDQMNGGEGADVMWGRQGVDQLSGGNSDDTLLGGDGNDSVDGGAENDSLDGGIGTDSLIGGTGNDTYVVDSLTDVVNETSTLAAEIDSVSSSVTWTLGSNLENLSLTGSSAINGTGNALANTLTGNTGNNSLTGGSGNDTLHGGTGNDTLGGGTGSDVYLVDSLADVISETSTLATEIDSVSSSVTWTLGSNLENLTLTGSSAINGIGNALANALTGNSGNNSLAGGSGDDTLTGSTGNDTLDGGTGDDTYVVDSIADVISEISTLDTEIESVSASVTWTLGNNLEMLTLIGSSAINGTGNALNNLITGNNGNNVLNGVNGADSLAGGLGNDTYMVNGGTDVISETSTLANEIDTVNSSATWTLGSNLENLTLTGSSSINGTGNSLDNRITGNGGNNGLGGGSGNDTLNGSTGDDTLDGGTGGDTYVVDSVTDVVSETSTLVAEIDTVSSSVEWTLGSNLERLTLTGASAIDGIGNVLANTLTGNTANNSLAGGSGNDTLDGGTGSDTLSGGTGNDAYLVDSLTDVVSETSTLAAEVDSVNSLVTWELGNNLENLTLTGASASNGTGNELANALTGNSGHNSLAGGGGNDTVGGGTGNDVLDGGAGADSMVGGAGNDNYAADSLTDVVSETSTLATEIDSVSASVTWTLGSNLEMLTLIGPSAINGTGNDLNNLITGNSGNNVLNGVSGGDSLAGGLGNDIYVVNGGTDVISETSTLATEIDTVNSSATWTLGSNLENLTLTGSSSINGTGNSLNNSIIGNSAANVLDGGSGGDTMTGGSGNDTYLVNSSADMIVETSTLSTEIDVVNASTHYTLSANLEVLTLNGSSSISGTGNSLDNVITGNSGNNSLAGGSGNDLLDGSTGVDTLSGGTGDDTYVVDSLTDVTSETTTLPTEIDSVNSSVTWTLGSNFEMLTLTGTSAINGTGNSLANSIAGNTGNNSLSGDDGNDSLAGGNGNDTLNGGNSNDTLNGGSGNDALIGGTGNDTYVVDSLTDVINETSTLAAEIDSVSSSVTWTLGSNFEKLTLTGTSAINGTGNSLANAIIGTTGNNSLSGADGSDSLAGGDGRDTLNGGNGNDTLNGGTWDDTLNGGNGNDSYVVDSETDTIIETSTLATEIDRVSSSATWTLGSNVENLTLTGTSSWIGGYGNAAANIIVGSQASNYLYGYNGKDTMDGGAGNDHLNGGGDADTYLFGLGSGQDVVKDWDMGPVDVILLGAGILQTEISFKRDFMSLEVVIAGSADKLVVEDWYLGTSYQIEQFRFADGTVISNGQVEGLLSSMATFGATTSSDESHVARSIQPWRHHWYATMLP